MIFFHDIETFNEVPLANGTHAYAEAAEIMIHSWAIDDRLEQVWDATDGSLMPAELEHALAHAEIIVGQNYGNFDRVVLGHHDIVIAPERIEDIMVQALSHGLPGGLDKLCEIFKVPVDQAKDKAGRALIQLFCKPSNTRKIRRATRDTHPVEWARFLDYAKSDIRAMKALRRRLPRWNYPVREHPLWCLDQRINDRGFEVDQDLARAAIDAVNRAKKKMDHATGDLTQGDVHSTTQRDALLKHLLESWGVELPDMRKSTLERRVNDENLPWPVRELIAIRLQVSTTSNAKYNSLLKAVSADGRLRGTMQFSGAARTKRWAGRTWQPQNLPRPDMEAGDIDTGIAALKANVAHLLYDEPIKLASNAIRGCIVAAEGKKLVVSDLQGIESRVLAWLAAEQWKIQAFRDFDDGTGTDIHRRMASNMLHKSTEEITLKERQSHGKHPEYACCYGGSKGALFAVAKLFNYEISEAEAMVIVREWRALHPALCDWDTGLWKQLDEAARSAIRQPGRVFAAGAHIGFERWRNWLKMHLPSGGFLSYAAPQIIDDPRRPGNTTVSYMGVNNYTKRWERLTTYGGKLSADATQSTAREIMAYNLPAIEQAGFGIVLLVHDEVVTETPDDVKYSVDNLNALLAHVPPWAKGLPLAAGGFETYRYKKSD